jgi:hypothetical protein
MMSISYDTIIQDGGFRFNFGPFFTIGIPRLMYKRETIILLTLQLVEIISIEIFHCLKGNFRL